MDTNLGSFDLTNKQFSRIKTLKSDVLLGFSYHGKDKKVVVVSSRELTENEKSNLITQIRALPDEELQSDIDAKDQKKSGKRQLLDALATLTSLTRKQVLKCLMEIVQDGNDD